MQTCDRRRRQHHDKTEHDEQRHNNENPIKGWCWLFKRNLVLGDAASTTQHLDAAVLEGLGLLWCCCLGAHDDHFLANESAMLVKSAMKIPSATATKIPEIIQNRMMTVVSGHPSNSK